MTGCVDSILKPNLYKDFYQHLKQHFGKPWIWESGNAKPWAQGIYTSLTRFEEMIVFSILL